MPLLRREKTLAEIEEETERLESEGRLRDAELTIVQKRIAAAELKKRGLQPKHFNFNFKKIIKWLKEH